MIKSLVRGAAAIGMAIALAGPAIAQRNEEKRESGPLQSPKPYGDRGSRIIGNPPIHYPNRPPVGADPVRYWKNRIISNPGCGGGVIIINGSPCYTPWYYSGFGFPGQYSDSYVYGNVNLGGFNLGYSQRNYSYGAVPPVVNYSQVQRPVDTRTQQYLDQIRERDAQQTGTSRKTADDDSYYLHQKPKPKASVVEKDPSLSQAVADIERAFRTGDIRPLEAHVNVKENLILASKGQSRKPMSGETYLELTRDALKNMKTVRFELGSAEPASNGAVLVYGTHVLQAEDGKGLSFNVGFVLAKRGDHWLITEVTADPSK